MPGAPELIDSQTTPAQAPAFAAQGRQPVLDLRLRIDGWDSALGVPLAAADAARLHQASRPAKFGQGERTLLDTSVRHTGEIGADAMALEWPAAQREALLREVSAALGTGPLEARLHSLLVYGPGQFFKPHQDTEKHDGMVGTLVLVWPSAHIGGLLRHLAQHLLGSLQGALGFASVELVRLGQQRQQPHLAGGHSRGDEAQQLAVQVGEAQARVHHQHHA